MSGCDPCSICGRAPRLWLRQHERELLRCSSCGFAWVPQGVTRSSSGRSIYEDDRSMFVSGSGAEYYLDDTAREAAEAKLQWVTAFSSPGGALLDVGANVGHFVSVAQRRFEAIGIEPSPQAVEWARDRLQAPVEGGSIYERRLDFVGRFDIVTLFDVIEHLPDPREAFARCLEYLTPSGRLFITTPDAGSTIARLLGRQWYYIDMKEHIALFSATNLTRLLEAVGFAVLATRTFGRRYRFSYVEQRLRYLAHGSVLLRLAHLASLPLRLVPDRRATLNFGDVMGVVAERVR